MPLFQGKSKKAFSKNVETEMHAGKPQTQALAIAYNMKKRPKKKMASGGEVSASNEKRPMPEDKHDDAKMVSQNSNDKAPSQDSWTSRPDKVSLKGRTFPLKRPKMVPSDSFSTKLMDEEDDLESSASVNNGPQHQPPKADDEEGADRQGPDSIDLHMKRMADGGMINEEVSMHDAEEDEVEHPAHLEEDDDQMKPSEDEYMSGHFAKGGMIDDEMDATASNPASRLDAGYGKVIMKADGGEISPEDEQMDELHSSIASAIMAKRRKMAEGGEVDLSINADEEPNHEDQESFEALKKENYSESAGLEKLDQPSDSNLHHVMLDSDEHDMISAIRRKMKSR